MTQGSEEILASARFQAVTLVLSGRDRGEAKDEIDLAEDEPLAAGVSFWQVWGENDWWGQCNVPALSLLTPLTLRKKKNPGLQLCHSKTSLQNDIYYKIIIAAN